MNYAGFMSRKGLKMSKDEILARIEAVITACESCLEDENDPKWQAVLKAAAYDRIADLFKERRNEHIQ